MDGVGGQPNSERKILCAFSLAESIFTYMWLKRGEEKGEQQEEGEDKKERESNGRG